MLKAFVKLFKAINSNSHPGEIAHAVSIGFIMGTLPKDNVFWYIFMVFFLFFRINKGAYAFFTLIFSLLAPALDPFLMSIGYWFLTLPSLENFFAGLLEIPFVGFTHFNNTLVMGSLLFSLLLYIPLYIITRLFLRLWRKTLYPAIRKLKVVVFISKLPLVSKMGELYEAKD